MLMEWYGKKLLILDCGCIDWFFYLLLYQNLSYTMPILHKICQHLSYNLTMQIEYRKYSFKL